MIDKKAGFLWDAGQRSEKAQLRPPEIIKALAWQARLLRAALLTQMAGKPTDNKLKDAEAEFRAAVLLDPSQPFAHYNLGIVLLKQERDADGIAELNALLALPKTDPVMAVEARRMIANPARTRTPFVPGFSFTTREHQIVSNASLRGKVALLDFWGSWCPPCRESVPILKELQRKYAASAFQLVGISSDGDEDKWRRFVESHNMDWTEYLDTSGEIQQAFAIDSFPTFIIVDKDGVIRFRQSGMDSETGRDLEDVINQALRKESDPALAKAAAAELNVSQVVENRPHLNTGRASKPGEVMAAVVDESAISTPNRAFKTAAPAKNVFKSARLGVRYEFPEGWITAQPEVLQEANDHLQASMRELLLKQQFQASENIQFLPPTILLYVSRRGDGEPEKPVLSSIAIRVQQTSVITLDEPDFRTKMDKMASVGQMKLLAPAAGFEVARHKFLRADFERSLGALHYYQTIVETIAGDSVLHIEILAASAEELRQIADSLQNMEIENEE